MRVLVTGARGLLGSELMALLAAAGFEAQGLGHAELDISDARAVGGAVTQFRPQVVVNCAGYTNVDGAESRPEAALVVNRDGATGVALAAAAAGARLIHVSSDYVYAGDLGRAISESDPERPISAYGQSKLEGDLGVRRSCPDHVIVRSAWLYGAHGKNFIDTILTRARAGETLRVVGDQIGSPTWARDLAAGIVALLGVSHVGTVHVANPGAVSWHGLALAALDLAGLGHVPIAPITTAELGRPAPRPAYSALDTTLYAKLVGSSLRPWQAALAAYLASRA